MTQGLSPKQRKFLKEHISGRHNSAKAAAIAAGYSPVSAKDTASKMLRSPSVGHELERLMNRMGLSDKALLQAFKDALQANRVISAVVSDNGRHQDANGQTCDFIEVPDHAIRIKSADRLMDYRHPELNQDANNGPRQVVIVYGHNAALQQAIVEKQEAPEANGTPG